MNSVEKEAVLHCLKAMIDEEVCEECPLYGTTGTDHCEKDCVRLAINALSSSEKPNKWVGADVLNHWIGAEVLDKIRVEIDQYLFQNEFGSEYRKEVSQIIDKHMAEGSDKE